MLKSRCWMHVHRKLVSYIYIKILSNTTTDRPENISELVCFQSDINTVTEGAHPQAYTNPGFTSLKAVPMIRPSDVQPQYTYQPTLLNTEMGTQEPDPDVDKPAGTPVIISQSTTSTTGTSGTAFNAQPDGAAADGGVWSLS